MKNKKILIATITVLVVVVLGIIVFMLSGPKFEKGIDTLSNKKNFTYKISLNSNDSNNSSILSSIESKVDNEINFEEGLFNSSYDDVGVERKYIVKKDNENYVVLEEKLSDWIVQKNIANEFSKLLIEEISGINNLKKDYGKLNFANVNYKTTINSEKVYDILAIYNEYFGIKKEDIASKDYKVNIQLDRKANLNMVEIYLGDNLKLNSEINSNGTILRISFYDFDSTVIDQDLVDSINTQSNLKPMALITRQKTNTKSKFAVNIPKLEKIALDDLNSGSCQTGDKIILKAIWSTDVYSNSGRQLKKFNAPVLKVKFGNAKATKADFVKADKNEIIYEYLVKKEDRGKISLDSFIGTVYSSNRSMGYVPLANKKISGTLIANEKENIPVKPVEPEIPVKSANPTYPNNKMTPEQIKEFANNSKNFITGVDKALPEVLEQLKVKIDASKLNELTLKDLISFANKIKTVFGNMEMPKFEGNNFETKDMTFTKANEFSRLTVYSNGDNSIGPILTVPATLHENGEDIDVYVVSLGGTEFVDGQATDIATDILSGLEFNNDYLKAVFDAISTLPQKKGNEKVKLVINGISLGGMVAQQVAANINDASTGLGNNFEVVKVISYGSPLISPAKRANNNIAITNVRRLCDENDIVPILSISNNPENNEFFKDEKQVENGNYRTFISAHTFGYIEDGRWEDYDALGVKNGKSSITVHFGKNAKFHQALLQK